MDRFPTHTTCKHAFYSLAIGLCLFAGFSQTHSHSQTVGETVIGTYHVPDLPQWHKLVRTDTVRSLVRYDKVVPKGSLTLKFTRFLQSKNTPAISTQEFVKNAPQESQQLKSMLEATATQVLSYSTQATQFQGLPAYLTEFRILRNHRIDEEKSLLFVNTGERYELYLDASQQQGSEGQMLLRLSGKEAQQAWNTVINRLKTIPATQTPSPGGAHSK